MARNSRKEKLFCESSFASAEASEDWCEHKRKTNASLAIRQSGKKKLASLVLVLLALMAFYEHRFSNDWHG